MLHLLYPFEYAESVFSIDYQKLHDLGFRGIIFDIDNTLVPHGEDATPEIESLLRFIQSIGLQTLMLSNNGESRIKRFLANVDSLYIANAAKPRVSSYHRALKLMGLSSSQALCIGDQVFTDIMGANLSGIRSILVKFIGYYTETDIGKRRKLERCILNHYEKSKYRHRLGNVLFECPRDTSSSSGTLSI